MRSDSTRWAALFALVFGLRAFVVVAVTGCSSTTSSSASGSGGSGVGSSSAVNASPVDADVGIADARRVNVELVDAGKEPVCAPPPRTIDAAPPAPSCKTTLANRSMACFRQYCANHAADIHCLRE